MFSKLVIKENKNKYDSIYKGGYDKKYPSLDLVRLEAWFFHNRPGQVLDYGFGVGENTLFLLEQGYSVFGIETSLQARRILQEKLRSRSYLTRVPTLSVLSDDAAALPYDNQQFDYIVCMSVLSLLGAFHYVIPILIHAYQGS